MNEFIITLRPYPYMLNDPFLTTFYYLYPLDPACLAILSTIAFGEGGSCGFNDGGLILSNNFPFSFFRVFVIILFPQTKCSSILKEPRALVLKRHRRCLALTVYGTPPLSHPGSVSVRHESAPPAAAS